MVYTGIRFYKYYGSLTLKNITGIRFYKYLWVSDPKKHSLFIGAEHRDICSYVNHQIIKGAEHRNIYYHFSIILRCAAPHSLHSYSVLQMLRVSDPKKHSLFIGAEHRNICSNANQPDVKKVQSTEISIIILSTILRCAAPHSLHAYSVLQMLRVSDPKNTHYL